MSVSSRSGSPTVATSPSDGGVQPRFMRIDITSDVGCPYCLLGLRQLLIAIEIYNHHYPMAPIHPLIRMLPYQLNPSLTETPISRKLYRAAKYGSAEAGDRITREANEKLASVGVDAVSEGLISATHLAHRLQTLALLRYPSHHLSLCLDLLTAYHTQSRHPSDRSLLAEVAVKNGIFDSERAALEWLSGDELDAEVRRSYLVARRLGVTGVPFFVFQGKWAASGAQGVDQFVRLLGDIVKRESAQSPSPSPQSTTTMANPLSVMPQKHQDRTLDNLAPSRTSFFGGIPA